MDATDRQRLARRSIGVAWELRSAPDGKRVYALIEAGKKSGLYRSDDGGNTWTLANSDPRLTSRAWYFTGITVDPSNPDVIYIPNVALYRSEDGGKTISIVRGAPGGDDYHQLWIDPKNSSHLILGTDQGTTISLNRGADLVVVVQPADRAVLSRHHRQRISLSRLRRAAGHRKHRRGEPHRSRANHRPATAIRLAAARADGSRPIPTTPTSFTPAAYTAAWCAGTAARRLSQDITPWPMPKFGSEINERKYRATWTPMLLFSPAEKNALYLGTQYVMKTTDGGLHWKQISPDLTGATVECGNGGKSAGPTDRAECQSSAATVWFSASRLRL